MSNLPDDKFTWSDDDLHRLLGHALLSYYGAANPPWCRILVIGHEPDTDERMGTVAVHATCRPAAAPASGV
jgi:hypothetical protein